MAKIFTRKRDKCRTQTPTFSFTTKALRGDPPRDTEAERDAKQKMIKDFLEKKNAKPTKDD